MTAFFQIFRINFGEKTNFGHNLVTPYMYNHTGISSEISIDKCRSKITIVRFPVRKSEKFGQKKTARKSGQKKSTKN